jgi:hypothetical protein
MGKTVMHGLFMTKCSRHSGYHEQHGLLAAKLSAAGGA